jgi:hypothetical protein
MPRLSLYHDVKSFNYRYIDRIIRSQYCAGGTDMLIHKYVGSNNSNSKDLTQPEYDIMAPTNIQDLLFLENRDRSYDKDIYRLRGHYSLQNLDFDLSQFGLFLNNDVIFITTHYNDMIDLIGRKLMVGDVLELPHLIDYHPLDTGIPTALKRFYQITDTNFASEGFSPTWYPHLWRIKCEPLINSTEFKDILDKPIDKDNYVGNWDSTKTYPPGYTVTFGDKTYETLIETPAGTKPPDDQYWKLIENGNLTDILSTYNKNIAINDAQLKEAKRLLPKSGYDTTKLYVVPTYGQFEENDVVSKRINHPATPTNSFISGLSGVAELSASIMFMKSSSYKNSSPTIRIPKQSVQNMHNIGIDQNILNNMISAFVQASLSIVETEPERTENGSHALEGNKYLSVQSLGNITGPYGTSDNTYSTGDQDITSSGFVGTSSSIMNFRADCDPRFQYIVRSTPRSFGYLTGWLTGDGQAPNGSLSGSGISFPASPKVGDYYLRIDYLPQILFRWDGLSWIRISENVRTGTGLLNDEQTQRAGFINNNQKTFINNIDGYVKQAQGLSVILREDDMERPIDE